MNNKPSIADVASAAPEATNISEIGDGGFKVVYLSTINSRSEAMKLVSIPGDTDEAKQENLARIRREIKILESCSSPFIVKLGAISPREIVIGTETYILYSEEYLPGNSLRESINNGVRPCLKELKEAAICMLGAVSELSRLGIIHRDIKPENLMVTTIQDRKYVLLDLGIAFQVGGTLITRESMHVPGTLYYIAPEMLDAGFRNNLDSRADIYTIGLTLYEFASGQNPFMRPRDPQFTTLYRIKTVTPAPLSTMRPDLPTELCKLIDQMIRKIPALRPSNIPMLVKRMEEFQ